ncbi:MAG: acyltransferase family protein [Desulfobacterium sp.]|nr:acyltransferase family protein [Desulfobacterium sp.]
MPLRSETDILGRHIPYIDFARLYAIAAVVVLHVSGNVVVGFHGVTPGQWWYGNVLNSFTRWCVPLFVMISGRVILGSEKTVLSSGYLKKKIARVMLPFTAWLLLYKLWEYDASGRQFSLKEVIASVLSGNPFFHLYFFLIILGLYLVAPMLRRLVVNVPEKVLVSQTLAFLAVPSLISLYYLGRGSGGSPLCGMPYNGMTLWLPFMGYFVAGFYFGKIRISHGTAVFAMFFFFLSGTIICFGTYYLFKIHGQGDRALFLYNYLSPPVVVMSLSVFILIRFFYGEAKKKYVATLASLTFGVFLIHPFVLYLLDQAGIGVYFLPLLWGVPLIVLLTLALSFSAVYLLKKLPMINRFV